MRVTVLKILGAVAIVVALTGCKIRDSKNSIETANNDIETANNTIKNIVESVEKTTLKLESYALSKALRLRHEALTNVINNPEDRCEVAATFLRYIVTKERNFIIDNWGERPERWSVSTINILEAVDIFLRQYKREGK